MNTMRYYSLRVIDIRQETKDSSTILFKQPGLKRIKYSAGQYLSVIFRINGRRYIRPYSFSSAPDIDETLNITVKRVQGGMVSNHLLDKLKIGEIVEVMEPMGEFTLTDAARDKHIYFWGAGSGITPIISIVKYALYNKKGQFITLAYGNRNGDSIILKEEIQELEKRFTENFSTKHFLTDPFIDELNPNFVQGRITSANVKSIINNNKKNNNDTLHYICGPVGLKESVKLALNELKVDPSKIFSEDFEIKRNPKDFENIHTRYVSIKKNGEHKSIEVVAGKSILEAGLDAFIDLSYSCQTGNCLVCRGKLITGEVKMIGVEKLPQKLRSDECLLCSSFPVSDNVEIEVE
jgi:ring-1,2-phenylacetyl-CoA epoxidase subunit PaaE